jgi:hypothetical protein
LPLPLAVVLLAHAALWFVLTFPDTDKWIGE